MEQPRNIYLRVSAHTSSVKSLNIYRCGNCF